MKNFVELTKPRITLLVALTTLAGYLFASGGALEYGRLLWTLIGTALMAAATGCLNQLMEIGEDRRMLRTQNRPLPQGRVSYKQALLFGLGCAVLGGFLLLLQVNTASCFLAAFTLLSYLFIYTPLKIRTPLATWIGAIPGAMPPLIGWMAAGGSLNANAWVLFGIQFLWQIPHFLALSWIYRQDYARAGFRVSSVIDPSGRATAWQLGISSAVLFPISLAPYFLGITGEIYLIGAALFGIGFLWVGLKAAWALSERNARHVFLSSLAYLPLIFLIMTAAR